MVDVWRVPSAAGDVVPDELDFGDQRMLRRLLGAAASAVNKDLGATRRLLERASALLDAKEIVASRDPEPVSRSGLAAWQVRRVASYVEESIDGPLRRADLARIAGLSGGHFTRAFRRSFGIGPHRYVMARRVDRAKHEMLSADTALCQIALICGFADQAHFSRVFRRVTGTTPNAWRRERRHMVSGGLTVRADAPGFSA